MCRFICEAPPQQWQLICFCLQPVHRDFILALQVISVPLTTCNSRARDVAFEKRMHMTCRIDAGSGFRQTAEFHILPWRGTNQSYYLHRSVSAKLRSGKKPSMHRPQAEGRGVSLVESAFPLSFSFTASLPLSQGIC